jgi:hypothetical protein
MSKYKINILDVLDLKDQRKTNRDIAEHFGVPIHAIENLLKMTGNTGMPKGQQRSTTASGRPARRTMLDRALDECDEVTIERGLNGGYIVTAGDHTGPEEFDLNEALWATCRMIGAAS